MWSVSRNTAGPLRRVVAADALEDAGAVVEAVRADVDARVVPVDELAVHPDLLGRPARCLLEADFSRRGHEIGRARAGEALEVGRRERRHVRGRAGADPDRAGAGAACRSISDGDRRRVRERRDRARLESGRRDHLLRARATRASRRADRGRDLAPRRRAGRPGRARARTSPSQTKTSDLTICSSLAADRARGGLGGRRPLGELLDRRVDRRGAQERRDALAPAPATSVGSSALRPGRAARTPRTRA